MDKDRVIPAFHFRIRFKGLNNAADEDSGFQSVSGLKISTVFPTASLPELETLKETTVVGPLVLRRALVAQRSALREWVLRCLNHSSKEILPEMLIEILDEDHYPALEIKLKDVTAAGWQLSELDALKSNLLVEEINLNYRSINVKDPSQ